MSKTYIFERWDIWPHGTCNRIDPESSYKVSEFDGAWVKADDAINRNAVQQAKIETLEVQFKDAKAALKRLEDLIANPSLLGMHVEGNSLEIGLQGPGPLLFAQGFSDYFKAAGGENFVEMSLTSPDPAIGELLCTLQRVRGETPTQQRDEARRRAGEMEARYDRVTLSLAALQPIVKFAGNVLTAHRNDGYPGDVDGAVIQEAAVECGLIERRVVSERCGDHCSCAEVVGADEWLTDGVVCYFDTDLAKIAKDAAK